MNGEQVADELERLVRGEMTGDDGPITTRDVVLFVREHLPTILAHLRAQSDAAVERAAKVMAMRDSATGDSADDWWEGSTDDYRLLYLDDARAALRAAVTP